jgi:predicted PurR-regulated permease PerM
VTTFNPAVRQKAQVTTRHIWLFVTLISVIALLVVLRQVVLLGVATVVLAILLTNMAKTVQRLLPIGRRQALALALVVFLVVVMGVSWVFGAQISNQIAELGQRLPEAISWIEQKLRSDPNGAAIVNAVAREMEGQGSRISGIAARAGGWAFGFLDIIFQSIVVLSAAIFLASDPRAYRGGILRLVAKPQRRKVRDVFDAIGRSLSGWLGGTLLSMTITAGLVLVCLLLFGVPAPVALALLAGLSQIVPLIGPIVSAGVGVLLAATVSFEVAGGVALAYLVISQLEANFITPTLLKRTVKVPQAMALFSILVTGSLFGSLGIVLAIPVILILFDAGEALRRSSFAQPAKARAAPGEPDDA